MAEAKLTSRTLPMPKVQLKVHTGTLSSEQALAAWLVDSGLSGVSPPEILEGFCQGLRANGIPLIRGHVSFNTLHPQVRAFANTWYEDRGVVDTFAFGHDDTDGPAWRQSPFSYMLSEGHLQLRRRLSGPEAVFDFPVLEEFRDMGGTDWLAMIQSFGWGAWETPVQGPIGLISSWTTSAAGGYSDAQVEQLQRLVSTLALAIKAASTYSMAETILTTYLGPDAGTRVMRGDIRRGDVQTLNAVLLLADLRGFTRLADSLPRNKLGRMLDAYLERMADPVQHHGGQVLKFLGDGMLATFSLGASPSCSDACGTALTAAEEILTATAALNRERESQGLPTMAIDLALHMGDVLYGNFGSADRLEFTVIGPAVNEVARIESLCEVLDSNLLISNTFASFATGCRPRMRSVGRHRLRGVRREQELFTLPEETAHACLTPE